VPVVSFRVDRETYEALLRKAEADNTTISDLLRRMVQECLGIQAKSELERRLEALEKKVQELERLLRRRSGLSAYLK